MTIMLLAAPASEKALLGSDMHATANIPGAANDALIGRIEVSCGDLVKANVEVAQTSCSEAQAQRIEPDGFPIAL